MPRYVVLHHQFVLGESLVRTHEDHFDWMFEHEAALWTWATDRCPDPQEDAKLVATQLPDHRREYLVYEGEVSGNRGHVTRKEAGVFEVIDVSADRYRFMLTEGRTAIVEFQRIRSAENLDAEVDRWYASFLPIRVEAS